MNIACIKELRSGENRVSLIPDVVSLLTKMGAKVHVETHAGENAFFEDAQYVSAGALIAKDRLACVADADIVTVVGPPVEDGLVKSMKKGSVLLGMLNLFDHHNLVRDLMEMNSAAFSLEFIPRISRAHSMDVLSSQASIAGYKAVILAASHLGKYFPMLTTAAGTIVPAKVFVLGAGVAGLQAIATARRLGAVVEAFDIRPAVKGEVESLGAKFVHESLEEDTVAEGGYAKEISDNAKQREQQLLKDHIAKSDVVITTAQVPGKKAPMIITESMVEIMKPGSVIVDLAAEQGGNCALTEGGKDILYKGIKILGPINLPSGLPIHASQLYARNVYKLLQCMIDKEAQIKLDFSDEIIDKTCVIHDGVIRNEILKKQANLAS
ncbi:MAG: Re/Si-specific NAD(P)(+) transhydrogenase subunit alpha [Chlamydiota bacterium]|nr:Re/Si-specific NAD(P)(+) transhydrogenase subunit alpha [Chlamydiota bacterium]